MKRPYRGVCMEGFDHILGDNSGLEIATDTVAFATQFFLFATRKTRVVTNLRLGFALTDTK